MIRCIAIDDEPPALALLEEYAEKTATLKLLGTFHRPKKALEFLKQHPVELIFLDINMPEMNGLELSEQLPDGVKIIFTTAYKKYAFESYRVQALDYLLKPIRYKEFSQAVQRAEQYFELLQNKKKEDDHCLFVKAEYQLKKIPLADLLFVENLKDYVRFHLADGTKIMSLMPLKAVLEKLPPADFMKVHRSYLIGTRHVTTARKNAVSIGSNEIPVSEAYRKVVQDRFR